MATEEQKQDTLAIENKSQEPSLQDQFDGLMMRYHETVIAVDGCSRAQGFIDAKYVTLIKFAHEHPEFKSQLPKKHCANDDGSRGLGTGVSTIIQDASSRGDACAFQ